MHGESPGARIAVTVLSVALLASATAGAWAIADDYAHREVLPAGTVVAGLDVGGMSRSEAARSIRRRAEVASPAPTTLRFRSRESVLDVSRYISIDVDGMLDEAQAPKLTAWLPARVLARAMHAERGTHVGAKWVVDEPGIRQWLAAFDAGARVGAREATRVVRDGRLRIIAEAPGSAVDITAAPAAIVAAVARGSREATLPATTLEPTMRADDLGRAILVRLGVRRLYLYDRARLVRAYPIAIGRPAFPTPLGRFTVTEKRRHPIWYNPGSDWSRSLPPTIGPSPNNPLGTRALNIDSPGIRIHGTSRDSSMGDAISHGCMRMRRHDIEDLFDRVSVGTTVVIVR